MALRDGLCLNCGSLMRVNEENETTSCIFCWASSNSTEAIALMEDDDDYEFPNESYPEPDDKVKAEIFKNQSLGGGIVNTTRTVSQNRRTTPKGKLTPKEKVALQNKPIVKPYVSKRHKIGILIGIVVFIIVLAGIGIPTYFSRENKKAEIVAALPDFISFTNKKENFDIQRQDNHYISIVSTKEVSEEDALDTFENYAKIYSDVYNISLEDAKKKIEVRLMDSVTGGFSIKTRDGKLEVISAKEVQEAAKAEEIKNSDK